MPEISPVAIPISQLLRRTDFGPLRSRLGPSLVSVADTGALFVSSGASVFPGEPSLISRPHPRGSARTVGLVFVTACSNSESRKTANGKRWISGNNATTAIPRVTRTRAYRRLDEAKVRHIVGLYLDPPDKALVLAADEKSQIQALDRTAPAWRCCPLPWRG